MIQGCTYYKYYLKINIFYSQMNQDDFKKINTQFFLKKPLIQKSPAKLMTQNMRPG